MAVEAEKLAERLRARARASYLVTDTTLLLLAEAVELLDYFRGPGAYVVEDWLRRVAEAHAEEGGDDG